MSAPGLRDQINENRAAQGLNKLPTGGTGKGSAPRLTVTPEWVGLPILKVTDSMVYFKSGTSRLVGAFRGTAEKHLGADFISKEERRLKENS